VAHLRLQTSRLLLVAATADLADAELTDRSLLARKLGAEIPLAWPPSLAAGDRPAVVAGRLRGEPALAGCLGWYLLLRRAPDRPLAVGMAGFRGPPDERGRLAMYCSVVPAYRDRGLATEAARALLGWALDRADVTAVRTDVADGDLALQRVMEKLGMVFQPSESGVGTFAYSSPPRCGG
jgi:RimJ/RimL family protein N-acetyltransferase